MKTISTPNAPAAIGPYSQAVAHAGLVYCSGQIPIDPATGALIEGDVAAQTRQVLANLDAVLAAAGTDRSRVLKTSVFLRDMADFGAMNAEYAAFFGDTRPARATVAVAGLPRDVRVEIDCIAVADVA
jgi:2-iminobutanoate/2-iminopropanoate deaminase